MRIDFNEIEPLTVSGMSGGASTITACMHDDERYRIIATRIPPGGSSGPHGRRAAAT